MTNIAPLNREDVDSYIKIYNKIEDRVYHIVGIILGIEGRKKTYIDEIESVNEEAIIVTIEICDGRYGCDRDVISFDPSYLWKEDNEWIEDYIEVKKEREHKMMLEKELEKDAKAKRLEFQRKNMFKEFYTMFEDGKVIK